MTLWESIQREIDEANRRALEIIEPRALDPLGSGSKGWLKSISLAQKLIIIA